MGSDTHGKSIHKLLDPDFRDKAFKGALVRLPINILARWLRISEHTWQEWRERSEKDPNGVEAQFFEEYDSKACELPVQLLARIAADKDWRSAAWLIACWFPQNYGRNATEASVQINVHAEIAQARVELQAAVCPNFMDDQDRALLEAAREKAAARAERKRLAIEASTPPVVEDPEKTE